MIGVLNYGVGNLASVCNSLDRLGIRFELVESPEDVARHVKLLLPGVGAFAGAAARLRERDLDTAIVERSRAGSALVLGVCLGMQLLYESSAEGGRHDGLGLIRGTVEFIGDGDNQIRVPHMGWNSVVAAQDSRLLEGCGSNPDFYFVHSFCGVAADRRVVAGTCTYGRTFDAVVEAGNVMGCQFHPEKSQGHGLRVLQNFAALPC